MTQIIESKFYAPSFSGHETFPLRQLWLKKVFNQKDSGNIVHKEVFLDEAAIARFGVGKNMVASIRHWAIAARLIDDSSDPRLPYKISVYGNEIFSDDGLDPYGEDPATAWFVHWCLAGEGHKSTTWFWLFNRVTTLTFSRDDLHVPLIEYAKLKGQKLSTTTLTRDIETCLRSYSTKLNDGLFEDSAEPMLGELGLIQEEQKGVFSFRRGPKITLSDGIFAFALVNFWLRTAPLESTLAFETIAYGDGSPGRVFKLDEDTVAEKLFSLSELTNGAMTWDDTAGLRQVIHRSNDFRILEIEMLRKAYV